MKHGATVQTGYNRIADAYLRQRTQDSADVRQLARLLAVLPPGALVLDAGCGAGLPIAALLTASGHRVVGLDFAVAQLTLARQNVPGAVFVGQDLTALGPAARGRVCGGVVAVCI